MILSNFSIFQCLPVRRNRRLHSTGLTINLTKLNNHPNSALNHLYSRCEWGSRAVLCILSTETAKCHSFAFRNHTFLPSKTMQCFKSNRAAHPQRWYHQLCYQAWLSRAALWLDNHRHGKQQGTSHCKLTVFTIFDWHVPYPVELCEPTSNFRLLAAKSNTFQKCTLWC